MSVVWKAVIGFGVELESGPFVVECLSVVRVGCVVVAMMEMDTTASTSRNEFVYPKVDPALMNDSRVLDQMLLTEQHYLPSPFYFTNVQSEILEHMRKTLTEWMLEVSTL
ncbi:unnamed protein product [Soboliphyme baturini]|uniref:Cyclin N-terminal domain-containing protein n=1 Tax=Soboliphyme baturini TaxID=241478 RepID=A0A183IXH9_9BILA|nr:unnamed protein product [Soboliphyme baturini]